MNDLKEQILRLTVNLEKDIEKLREKNSEQLVGTEIMAINAICNAIKTIKEIG